MNLSILQGVIGGARVIPCDRMGRNIAFLCRIYDNGWSDRPHAISIDEETALLIDTHASGTVWVKAMHIFCKLLLHQKSVKQEAR
ncbi:MULTISPECIES: hypothetical protein [Nitrosomonas]|uniref:Uncharacterized protein n=1 Tax=Nitrosomonas communis TaxID=44574 RepID=A0A0F7KFM7_9PROT|nr:MULTISPECIES: hypothetical protein [Nitrosomonas]AKH37622.1 hypothetical protein AAW31_07050 [Nitrosomonas communis]TYP71574.1 hypothetical protein BCL69_11123 [Nitrosomonas communis]UVS62908.1 hypothetical protein NX761_07345 [Nitrosomonas sp. PLL12]